jgi:hypothetical protein
VPSPRPCQGHAKGRGVIGAIRLSPQLFKPCRVRGSVLDGVLNVPVSKKILNEPRVGSLVGQSKAASVAEHVRMGNEGQGSGQAVRFQKQIASSTYQRLSAFFFPVPLSTAELI